MLAFEAKLIFSTALMCSLRSPPESDNNPGRASPQRAAIALLDKQMRVFEANHSGETTSATIRDLLADEYLPELLFGAIPTKPHCREGNADVYGVENEDIQQAFARLRISLDRLARSGIYDRDVLSCGEDTLATLIHGVRDAEEGARRGINPAVAAKLAAVDDHVRGTVSDDELDDIMGGRARPLATPDQVDDIQAEAFFCYRWYKSGRETLEAILDGIRDINRQAGRGHSR